MLNILNLWFMYQAANQLISCSLIQSLHQSFIQSVTYRLQAKSKILTNHGENWISQEACFLLFDTFQTKNTSYISFHLTLLPYFYMQFACNRSFEFIFVIASLLLVTKDKTGRGTAYHKLNILYKYISKFTSAFYSYYLKITSLCTEIVENMKYSSCLNPKLQNTETQNII